MITTQEQTRLLNIFLVMLSSLQLFSCFVFFVVVFVLLNPIKPQHQHIWHHSRISL